ncbi:MAG: alpha/beta hydrolase [Dehalococcoidia bacterium]
MAEITHRTVQTNGINMHIAEAGEGPLVLMLHGFPELWYSYRHQLPALADAGYHAVAPDIRGYGQSDAPQPIEAYAMKQHLADALGLLDVLGAETAVVVGHDWGAPMAWNSAALYPERYRAVVGMSVPFLQRSPAPPTQLFKQVFQDNFFYMLYFQEPGVAEKELEADPRKTLRTFLCAASGDAVPAGFLGKKKGDLFLTGMANPETLPAWLTEADVDVFAEEFTRTGFRGGLNRYRNMDRDWEELPELADAKIAQPALFIGGDKDGVIAFTSMDAMKANCTDLRDIAMLPGAGHWTQQERPAEVNKALIEFLKSLD